MKEHIQAKPENENGQKNRVDRLTGTWNEEYLRSWITGKLEGGGALFLCDINNFQQINDQFGHFKGDQCLKHVAKTLGCMIRGDDILGRTGGDKFIIFMPGCQDLQTALEICKRIEERFRMDKRNGNQWMSLSVTVGTSIRGKGDVYQTMVERAKEEVARRRAEAGVSRYVKLGDSYQSDVMQIREDLMEEVRKPGAYCQDYETFKSIYRFLERRFARSKQKACLILFTLVDGKGKILLPAEKDILMERLGEVIQKGLRIGDVYTRYSSSQYLILLVDTTEEIADMVADRVSDSFCSADEEGRLLAHYCYALQPARILEQEKESQV